MKYTNASIFLSIKTCFSCGKERKLQEEKWFDTAKLDRLIQPQ
jgi:hypothetical protein